MFSIYPATRCGSMSALFKRVAFHWKRCWVCPTLYNMFVGDKSRTGEPSERRIELDALLPEYAARLRQKGARSASSSRNTAMGIRRVTVTRISASCCSGTCFNKGRWTCGTLCGRPDVHRLRRGQA